ncbi:YajG family lipoprotein [Acinetobacter rudis]|uniref:YajG family lipoprotein n=1 Tax=Acinetobacter rudis TaxID=632955 RepID=UPI00333F4222
MNKMIFITLMGFSVLLGGCATSRGLIDVPVSQKVNASQAISDSKKIVIVITEDNRVFQDKPHSADIPSLKVELSKASEDEKARAVARKRNGFGKALGDILLKEDTVSKLLEKRVTNALEQAGYQVLENNVENTNAANLILNIKINKFWSWFQPGFSSIKIHTEIDTNIVNTKDANFKPLHVYSKVTRSAQIANNTKWIENIDQAIKEYEEKLISALPKTE